MNIDPLKDFTSLRIPKVPKQTKLRIYVAIAFLGGCIAFLTPISLSLNLTGKIASKGPSTEIKTNLDSIVSYIAEENKLIKSGEVLIKFNQPNLKADITITKTELNSIESQIKASLQECSHVEQVLNRNIAHANESYSLKKQAFELETISKLNLLTARGELDDLYRQKALHQQRCTQDQEKLMGDKIILEKQLDKQISSSALSEIITAPANGYLHRVNIKTAQQVSAGQILALFTSEGTAGANLIIPLKDRPFVQVGDTYLITSDSYQIFNNPPVRQCIISSISPDSFSGDQSNRSLSYEVAFEAQCEFQESPLQGQYPFLVGMRVNGSATSVKSNLVQLLLEGYRRLITNQIDTPTQ